MQVCFQGSSIMVHLNLLPTQFTSAGKVLPPNPGLGMFGLKYTMRMQPKQHKFQTSSESFWMPQGKHLNPLDPRAFGHHPLLSSD